MKAEREIRRALYKPFGRKQDLVVSPRKEVSKGIMWPLVPLLALAVGAAGSPIKAPTTPMGKEEAASVIARTRKWVGGYMEALPNFTCRKRYRLFMGTVVRNPKLREWAVQMPAWAISKTRWERRLGNALIRTGKIHDSEWLVRMVKGQQESYEWIRGNKDGYAWGFMGAWLKALFHGESQTEFRWIEDTELRGYGVHVFETVTPRNFYQYGAHGTDDVVVVGFQGKIYIERDTGRVLRYVAEEPIGLGKRHRVKSGKMLFDYDYVEIGGEVHLLPVKTLDYTRYHTESTLGEARFDDYKQFKSEIKLDFGGR